MDKSQKQEHITRLKHLAQQHKVIGVLNMHKLPARQLQQMREGLRGAAIITMTKKTLLRRALPDDMHSRLEGRAVEPGILFSNESPFRLYKRLKESRTPAAAKTGDIATKDISIPAGPTPLPPGPAISTLTKIGLKASVQNGKIAVMADKVVCKTGDAITEDVAAVLNLLKIEPMEIGLDLLAAFEEGICYDKTVLDVDPSTYLADLQRAAQQAINLSLNTGYLTTYTAPLAIQKAFWEARSLAIETNSIEKDFIDDVLAKAAREAKALQERTNYGDQ